MLHINHIDMIDFHYFSKGQANVRGYPLIHLENKNEHLYD